ncbi:hypothetical protein GCM10010112_93870 [Actinoplanes lobatus]|uniref:Uncharacterized protein n=1 Tax=Actinoplanes lobatus TaxID=113568 RepID=A0A7W7HKJ0_9ACTN|nr:hypothetical protein [Actinoplanes lobatus]MBB4752240.1 hypothetical protein [Actinoplanes lobatus]GGN99770.1 hypothetical protein GCM10010112_93870 [Actinoplanes lobatus]GIE45431.1 hypothetical protein Alo02nite_83290 [Actinoplanes lobatus]
MEQPGPIFVAAFVRSVAVLALEADAQVAWLGVKGLPLVDELALEFDDGFRLVPTFIERGWLNDTALPVLAEIDEHLSSMSGEHNAGLWHVEALTRRTEWDQVRALARTALTLLA